MPFRNYPDLLELQKKNYVPKVDESHASAMAVAELTHCIAEAGKEVFVEAVSKGTYYSVLSDGITDNSVQEQELVNILFVHEGRPRVTFLDIEIPKSGGTERILNCIAKAFKGT